MQENLHPVLSLDALVAEHEARLRRQQEADRALQRDADERLADFRRRLETFEVTAQQRQMTIEKIKHAFDRGESEIMLGSFPSDFCSDSGRAIINANQPPLNEPETPVVDADPDWVATLPAGVRRVYAEWKQNLKPGGFHFEVRIISFPGGKPGDVGLFLSWPTERRPH